MTEFVLDASAVLAFINKETGWELVERVIWTSLISSVNYAEVFSKLIDKQMSSDQISKLIVGYEAQGLSVVPYQKQHAVVAAELRSSTRHVGLSLGDRSCLAVAKCLELPVMTADKRWAEVADEIGIPIVLIR